MPNANTNLWASICVAVDDDPHLNHLPPPCRNNVFVHPYIGYHDDSVKGCNQSEGPKQLPPNLAASDSNVLDQHHQHLAHAVRAS